MNFTTAKKHHKAALQTARYYRFLMLLAKKPTAANEERVARQRVVAVEAMRAAMGRPIEYLLNVEMKPVQSPAHFWSPP